MLPWSVLGGASKSGFCLSMGTFNGPKSFAPKKPRIGSGCSVVSSFHKGRPGSKSIPGRVVWGGMGSPPADVGDGFTVEVGFAVETGAAEESTDREETAAALDEGTAGLAGAGTDVPAGAAETKLTRRRAQKQVEMRIIS